MFGANKKSKENDWCLPILLPEPPKSKEYNTILELLNDAEKWIRTGDRELQSKMWSLISEKAAEYSKQVKDIVPLPPEPPKDRTGMRM